MFGNPFYTGLIELQDGRTYPGSHKPMVTRQEFERAQEILGRPTRPKPQKHAFPHTGLITCAICGGCVTQIEEQFAAMLVRLSMPKPVLDWLLKKAHRQVEGEEGRREQVLAAQKAALESTRRQERTLFDLRLRELITDEVFQQRRNALAKGAVELEEKLVAATRSGDPEKVAEKVEKVVRFGEAARDTFLSGTEVQRRAILEAVESNYTLRARKMALQLEQPFQILSEANGCSNWWATIDDIRTWLLEKCEGFWLPNLDEAPIEDTVP